MTALTLAPGRVRCGAAWAALLLAAAPAAADDAAGAKTTHTYKTVGEMPVRADVYRPPDGHARPAVVWIHGGALLIGGRKGVPDDLLRLCRAEGAVLVSIDYRLAPATKLPAIVEDVHDAVRWLRAQGPKLFAIDPDRIVVAGGSAGGYLTLMTGVGVEPRPKALVSYWGFGEVDADWLTTPSPHFRARTPVGPRDEVFREVLTNSADNPAATPARVELFHYLRQNGLWCKEVTGFDPAADRRKLDPFCPARNVTPAYPPTLLIHGTADTDVPVGASETMAAALAREKVPHELIVVRGAGHGLGGGDKALVADAHERALAFIRKHLK
jgi:acetyl esterase/lipase